MESVFTSIDWVIFFAALVGAMAVGLVAGRKEETAEDYFLAGRQIPWWGVAGSIFGSNVSANHMVGMMGIGFSVGFAQSHFELGAIAGLMLLCYGFLPVYRKLRIYTLSEYLGRRYDERSRLLYAVIMIVIMALVQMVPALYIGARSICVLIGGEAVTQATTVEPTVGDLFGQEEIDEESSILVTTVIKNTVNMGHYSAFVIALAIISASYTIFGGLKAVVWTDVFQSVLLLIAGIIVAVLIFDRLGGWAEMMARDGTGSGKMHLYLPSNHPALPWTGIFTGLLFMHFFYWGTNQFVVQRALAARSDTEARIGIVAAGFLKLLIPFFSVAAGIAAFYLFKRELPERTIAPDTVFTEAIQLVSSSVIGTGIVGLITAGLIGAILSSIDSMMNSAATIVTVDIYKRHINPAADDRRMIFIGRVSIVVFVITATLAAIFIIDPNSNDNFFLTIADYSNYMTPGLFIAFFIGMFWRRATATGAIVTIIAAIVFSGAVQYGYDNYLGMNPKVCAMLTDQQEIGTVLDKTKIKDLPETMQTMDRPQMLSYLQSQRAKLTSINRALGGKLNFFHRVLAVLILSVATFIIVSLCTADDAEKQRLTWTDLGGHDPGVLRSLVMAMGVSIGLFALLGWAMVAGTLDPTACAIAAAVWTMAMSLIAVARSRQTVPVGENGAASETTGFHRDDRLWAGLLCSLAMFMMYYFY